MAGIAQKTNISIANAHMQTFMEKVMSELENTQIETGKENKANVLGAFEGLLGMWNADENQAQLVEAFKASSPKKGRKKSSKKKDKNAPKRGKSAYIFFCGDHRAQAKQKLQEQGEPTGIGAVGKELGRMWTQAKEGDISKWKKMETQDKERYENEKETYVPAEEVKTPKKKSSGKKRGKSAYIFFTIAERIKIKQDKPDLKGKDVMKELGERWAEAKKGDIGKWEQMAAEDKQRVQEESEESGSEEKTDVDEEAKKIADTSPPPPNSAPKVDTMWKSKVDKKSGKTYYINKETRETQWNKPDEFDEETPPARPKTKRVYAYTLWVRENKTTIGEETKLTKSELTKELSRRWKEMDATEKEAWKEKAQAE